MPWTLESCPTWQNKVKNYAEKLAKEQAAAAKKAKAKKNK